MLLIRRRCRPHHLLFLRSRTWFPPSRRRQDCNTSRIIHRRPSSRGPSSRRAEDRSCTNRLRQRRIDEIYREDARSPGSMHTHRSQMAPPRSHKIRRRRLFRSQRPRHRGIQSTSPKSLPHQNTRISRASRSARNAPSPHRPHQPDCRRRALRHAPRGDDSGTQNLDTP
jgi:hypothetical protein